jgi:hypothetical protein
LNVWNASWHQAVGLAAGSALLAVLMTADRLSTTTPAVAPEPAAEPVGFFTPAVSGCGDDLR